MSSRWLNSKCKRSQARVDMFLRSVAKTSTALVLLRFAATMFTMNAAVKPQVFEITT